MKILQLIVSFIQHLLQKQSLMNGSQRTNKNNTMRISMKPIKEGKNT